MTERAVAREAERLELQDDAAADLAARDSGFPAAEASPLPSARVRGLQRTAGNRAAAAYLQRDATGGPPPPPRTRGSESDYITAAQGYITAYSAAAKAGVTGFTNALPTSGYDWGNFWLAASGNVIWAAACFGTGGAAFVVSMAGIAVSTGAGIRAAPGPGFDVGAFATKANDKIDDVGNYLNDQVARVVGDVYAKGSQDDDSKIREEVLRRMFEGDKGKYFNSYAGGLPNVNMTAISATVKEELLILANAEGSKTPSPGWAASETPIAAYHGSVMYSYKVPNLYEGGGVLSQPDLVPMEKWKVSGPSVGLVASANVGDINASMNQTQQHAFPKQAFDVEKFPCKKAVNVYYETAESPTFIVELSESNAVSAAKGFGRQADFVDAHQISFGTQLVTKLWGGTKPPKVGSFDGSPAQYELSEGAGAGF